MAGGAAAGLGWWWTPVPERPASSPPPPGDEPAKAPRHEAEPAGSVSSWQSAVRKADDRWEAMRAAIGLARAVPPSARHQWLRSSRFRHRDPLVVEVFCWELGRLAFEDDPGGFIVAELQAESPRYRDYLRELAATDPDAVVVMASEMENAEVRSACLTEVAMALAGSDPEALFRLIPEIPNADGRLLVSLQQSARGDAGRLMEVADRCGDEWRRLLSAAAVLVKAEGDMQGAMAWLDDQEGSAGVLDLLLEADSESWGGMEKRNDFHKRLAGVAGKLPDGWLSRNHTGPFSIEALVTRLAMGNEVHWLDVDFERQGLSADACANVRMVLLQVTGLAHPDKAAEMLATDGLLDEKRRGMLFDHWMREAALDRVELPAALSACIDAERGGPPASRPSPRAPAKRLTIAQQLDRSAHDSDSYGLSLPRDLLGQLPAPQVLREAEAWAKALPDDEIRNVSARLIRTGTVPPVLGDNVFPRAMRMGVMPEKDLQRWTSKMSERAFANPELTARSLELYPACEARDYALINVALRWHELDPDGAARWVNSLPQTDRERAAAAIKKAELSR